jgi:hypothetical protein
MGLKSMTALSPTPARLSLLRTAKAGYVVHWPEIDPPWTSLELPGESAREVTKRVQQQIDAGWLAVTGEVVQHFGRRVRPTLTGEALLIEHTAKAGPTD